MGEVEIFEQALAVVASASLPGPGATCARAYGRMHVRTQQDQVNKYEVGEGGSNMAMGGRRGMRGINSTILPSTLIPDTYAMLRFARF